MRCQQTSRITYLGVGLNFEPAIAKMALATERVYRRRIVVSDFLLLRIVAHAHANMVVACSTNKEPAQRHKIGKVFPRIPPYVEG
jgi:hypothetical protein